MITIEPPTKSRQIEQLERMYGIEIRHITGYNYQMIFQGIVSGTMRMKEIKDFCERYLKEVR